MNLGAHSGPSILYLWKEGKHRGREKRLWSLHKGVVIACVQHTTIHSYPLSVHVIPLSTDGL